MRAALLGLASAAALAVSPVANAQVAQTLAPGKAIDITGRANGAPTTFSFLLDHFEARNGRVFAVGALSGGGLPSAAQVAIPLRNGNQGRGGGDDGHGNQGRGGDDGNDERGGFGGFGSLQPGNPLTQPALFQGSNQSSASFFDTGATPLVIPAQVSCPVLNLVLGPLNLNLLGLAVNLNQVVLDIVAVPGALLGNLLCAVAGLLNGLNLGGLLAGVLANLLNAVVAALAGLPV
jgi:hypothetical protein